MSIYYTTFNVQGINFPQQQNLMATSPNTILALLTFIIPVLINLIDLKFQKEVDSVFQAHPITTSVAIVGLLVFVSTFGIEFTFHSYLSRTCAAVLRTTIVYSGSLSLASLASLLFPDSWRPLIYLIYALLSLGSLHRLVRKWFGWVHQEIMDKLHTLFTRMQQWHMRRSPATLPLTNMDLRYRVHVEGRVDPQVP